jgi:hypothetical protein
MISRDMSFGGFSAEQWVRLLSLWTGDDSSSSPDKRPFGSGTVVSILDDEDEVIAAFHTERGPIDATSESNPNVDLSDPRALCEAFLAARAFVLREGVAETLVERAAMHVSMRDSYAGQWVAFLNVARGLALEGKLRTWPGSIAAWRIPSAYSVARGLDALLPDETSLTLVLWRQQSIWTSLTLSKRSGVIDHIVGPETLVQWSGPLGGDYRRDYRPIARAISRNLAPLHIGVFADEAMFRRLLADPTPGAWARAVSVRDVIVYPSPGYVAVAVGADAMRAVAQQSALAIARFDLAGLLAPLASMTQRALGAAPDLRTRLGLDSLKEIGAWLRTVWIDRGDQ